MHARYVRRVRDLPVQGERVIIRLQARKFLCDNRECARRVFCERFGEVIRPFARMTDRLEAALQSRPRLRANPRVLKRAVTYYPPKRAKHANWPQPTKQPSDAIVILK